MWAFGNQGYGTPNNYVSMDSNYDPYATNNPTSSVSTDPNYNPYTPQDNTSLFSNSNLQSWGGAALNGVASYADAQAKADAAQQVAQMDAKSQLDMMKQQRGYTVADKAYKSAAVSNWSKYFQG